MGDAAGAGRGDGGAAGAGAAARRRGSERRMSDVTIHSDDEEHNDAARGPPEVRVTVEMMPGTLAGSGEADDAAPVMPTALGFNATRQAPGNRPPVRPVGQAPAPNSKAYQILVRSQSLMGDVQQQLAEDVFEVPGQQSCSPAPRLATGESLTVQDVERLEGGSGGAGCTHNVEPDDDLDGEDGTKPPRRLVPFRTAVSTGLIVMLMTSMLLVGGMALLLMDQLTKVSIDVCATEWQNLQNVSNFVISRLVARDTLSHLSQLERRLSRGLLAAPKSARATVAFGLDEVALAADSQGQSGAVVPVDQPMSNRSLALAAGWQASIGPTLLRLRRTTLTDQAGYLASIGVVWPARDSSLWVSRDRPNSVTVCFPAFCEAYPLELGAAPNFTTPLQQVPRPPEGDVVVADREGAPSNATRWHLADLDEAGTSPATMYSAPLCAASTTCSEAGGILVVKLADDSFACTGREHLDDHESQLREWGLPAAPDAQLLVLLNGLESEEVETNPHEGAILGSARLCASSSSPPSSAQQQPGQEDTAAEIERLAVAAVREALGVGPGDAWVSPEEDWQFRGAILLANGEEYILTAKTLGGGDAAAEEAGQQQAAQKEAEQGGNKLALLAVSVFPQSTFAELVSNVTEESFRSDLRLTYFSARNPVGFGVLAAMLVVGVCAALVARHVSFRFSAKLVDLSHKMQGLDNLEFERVQTKSLSQIREVRTMQTSYNTINSTIKTLSKFVPALVLRNIVSDKHGKSRRLHVVRKPVTILFSDIRNFTSIAELLSEEELLFFLTKYLSIMTRIVEAYRGEVGEILGDGVLAFWNTPNTCEDHAALAAAAAVAMQHSLAHVNERCGEIFERNGISPIGIRVGIHTGKVLTGNIGSLTKMKFGCIGDPINLASRLEGICKLYEVGIICSGDTFAKLPQGVFLTRELDLVAVKGKTQPVALFEIVAMVNKLTEREELCLSESAAAPASSPSANRSRAAKSFAKIIRSSLPQLRRRTTGSEPPLNRLGSAKPSEPLERKVGHVTESSARRRAGLERYEEALGLFQEGKLAATKSKLQSLIASGDAPGDAAAALLLSRTEAAMSLHGDVAPAAEWSPVLDLETKEF